MDIEKETNQSLLPILTEDEIEPEYTDWHHEKTHLRRRYLRQFLSIQAVFLLLYTAVGAILWRRTPCTQRIGRLDEQFVYTPALSVDKFQPTELNMHLYKDNPYKGPPSDEVDAAWNKLFTNAYIRLSENELENLGRNSTPIPDGSGDFFGALDVYHQLHCVRFIFQYVHQDYYTLKKINVPAPDHINHCIDVLRQVVMCAADTSISTLTFHNDYPRTWPEFKFQHSCRNWEAVDNWAGSPGRAIDQSDPERLESWLQNPNFVDPGPGNFFDGHGEEDAD